MCGISGIFEFAQQADFTLPVKAMNAALAHRGPDNDGIFSDAGITLGHRRLSIIDLSAAGNQPMFSADGRYALVFNGEVYNYRELKNELRDVAFQTGSDTEVLLMAWIRWGVACLDKLNGMFAFALWDKTERKLHLVRDRLGVKPLYIFQDNKLFAFASEIRALMASRLFSPQLNTSALGDYLRYQTVHAPATIVRDVRMLMPGHRLEIDASGVQDVTWWQLPDARNTSDQDYASIKKEVRNLLRAAVERRLVSDVPFGAFLSGGIDSSAIVGLMREVSTTPVNTFSVTFDDSEFSEAVYARLIATKFKTTHHEIKLRPADFLNDLPNALLAMDHPSGDGPNTYIVSKATKQAGITMALSGLGGDELFAGYAIFKQAYALQQKKWINRVPRFMRAASGNVLRQLKPGIASDKMAEVLRLNRIGFDTFYPLSRQVLLEEQVQGILSKPIADPGAVETFARIALAKNDATHFLSVVSNAEIQTYMQNVLLRDSDQMSMAHALELRVPFLDYTLVEYALQISDTHKFPHTPKRLLTDALADLLPREIIDRPKMGFTLPWKHWMKNELRSFCETQLQALAKRPEFDAQGIDTLWQAFLKDDKRVTWSRVWPLVVLAHWLKQHDIN